MDNPGIYSLSQNGTASPPAADLAITQALTGFICLEIDDLDGIDAVSLLANFQGTGGTTADVWVQTSLDQGSSWIDIANFHFTAAGTKAANLSGLTPVTAPITPTDGTLAANTCQDGILGDRLRAKVSSTGTWVDGLLKLRAAAR